jgi:hypothetical protein
MTENHMSQEDIEWLYENIAGFQQLTEDMDESDAQKVMEQATSLTATSPTFQMPNEDQLASAEEYRKKHPNIATVVGLRLSEESYRLVANFVADHDLGDAASPSGMFIPLLLNSSYQPIEIDSYLESLTFEVSAYSMEFAVGDYGDADETLLSVNILEAEENTQDPIWQLRKNLSMVYPNEEFDWESMFFMPIAAPNGEFEYEEEDELARSKLGDLREYCGVLKFDRVFVKHLPSGEMLDFLAGGTGALLDD